MITRFSFSSLLREPLLHFLIGALVIFAFFWATGSNNDPAERRIELSASDIDRLRARWIQTYRRPPTKAEFDALINDEIADEIYYREALRLGMDQNDPVVRRRLVTKMRYLNVEDAYLSDPTDLQLEEWVKSNPEKYRKSAQISFEHIYLGNKTLTGADKLVSALNSGALQAGSIRKPLSLPISMDASGSEDIARNFGEAFASAISSLPAGGWKGPVESGFGFHLVRVDRKVPGKPLPLEQVRVQAGNDWRAAQLKKAEEASFKKLRSQYEISIGER